MKPSISLVFLLLFAAHCFAEDPAARTIAGFGALDSMFSSYCKDGGAFPHSAGAVPEIMNALMNHAHSYGGSIAFAMDGWMHPLHYYYNESEKVFFLISYGADGNPDAGLYDSNGRPTLTSVTSIERPEQDLICKHDLNSDRNCRILTEPGTGSRNATNPSEPDRPQSLNPHLNEIPNAMDQNEKLQATITRIRRIGSALQTFSNQNHRYPAGASLQAISNDLEPAFIKDVPKKDGWGNPLQYLVEADGSNCWLISYGADGDAVRSLYDRNGKPLQNRHQDTNDFNDDLIYSCEKGFLRSPAGVD